MSEQEKVTFETQNITINNINNLLINVKWFVA